MAGIQQNTLYLTTPGSYVARDHLTLQIEVPEYPADLPQEDRNPKAAIGWRKLSVPIHLLESICVFGPSTISPPALDLCWEHGVAVNFLNESGYLQARMTGVADTSVTLRRTHFRAGRVERDARNERRNANDRRVPSPSSNRICRFPASGFRMALLHDSFTV